MKAIDNWLQTVNPSLAKEWHPTKNLPLIPQDFSAASKKKVWWRCSKGHDWQAAITNRTYGGSGCPFCSGRKASSENSLEAMNPRLSKEWHSTKNGSLTLADVRPGSEIMVWWKCHKGHEWQAFIYARKVAGCPYCSNRKIIPKENSLAAIYPELAAEWHPTKNAGLGPDKVAPHASKMAWWMCPKNHEWQAPPDARATKGSGCPYCSGRKVGPNNNLAYINPAVAKTWHPTKNGSLTPRDVTPSSNRKVWWICKRGHEWLTTGPPYMLERLLNDEWEDIRIIAQSRLNKNQSGR